MIKINNFNNKMNYNKANNYNNKMNYNQANKQIYYIFNKKISNNN